MILGLELFFKIGPTISPPTSLRVDPPVHFRINSFLSPIQLFANGVSMIKVEGKKASIIERLAFVIDTPTDGRSTAFMIKVVARETSEVLKLLVLKSHRHSTHLWTSHSVLT